MAAAAAAACLNPPCRRRSRKPTSTSSSFFDGGGTILPDHLVREILTLLPVKTLIRFKRVHPSWQVLIACPSFIYDHYRHRQSLGSKIYYGLTVDRTPKLRLITSSAQNSDSELTLPIFIPNSPMANIVGPCFGVYCVQSLHNFFLLNFSTRWYKMLPPVKVEGERFQSGRLWHSGFGSIVNEEGCIEFKVGGFSSRTHLWPGVGLWVYTFSSDSWKLVMLPGELSDVGIAYGYLKAAPAFVNGAFHWMVYRRPGRYFILYFHLESETFGTIELPKVYAVLHMTQITPNMFLEISSLRMAHIDDKSLCVAVSYLLKDECVQIWAMREYGVESTWYQYTKIDNYIFSKGVFLDGFLFGNFHENVLSCEGMKAFQNACGPHNMTPRVFRYEESLISLGGTWKT